MRETVTDRILRVLARQTENEGWINLIELHARLSWPRPAYATISGSLDELSDKELIEERWDPTMRAEPADTGRSPLCQYRLKGDKTADVRQRLAAVSDAKSKRRRSWRVRRPGFAGT